MSNPLSDRLEALELLYRSHGDKIRFLFVGMLNTAFGYGLYLVLLAMTRIGLEAASAAGVGIPTVITGNYFLISQWASWVLSVPFGTWTLKNLVFRSPGRYLPQMIKAYAVYLPGTLVNSVGLWLAVQALGLAPSVGQLLALTVAVMISYLGHKYFTFRTPENGPPTP